MDWNQWQKRRGSKDVKSKSTKCAWEAITAEKGKNKQLMNIYDLQDTILDALTYTDMFNPHKNYLQ